MGKGRSLREMQGFSVGRSPRALQEAQRLVSTFAFSAVFSPSNAFLRTNSSDPDRSSDTTFHP